MDGLSIDPGGEDWKRGPARIFGAGVMLVLAGLGFWVLRSREARESKWNGVGEPLSIAAIAQAVGRPESTSHAAIMDGTLSINLATPAQLELLPGIGPAGAARIVAYREQIGGFRNLDELAGVKGIGERTLERLRPLLRFDPAQPRGDR